MKKAFIIGIFICCLWACHRKSEIVYQAIIWDETATTLTGNTLNNTFLFSLPTDIFVIDSIVLVHDSYTQDACFHLFNKSTGDYLLSFGNKGRGPGELLSPESVSYEPVSRTFTAYDPNLRKLINYDLTKVLSRSADPSFTEFTILDSPNFTKQILKTPHSYIAKGNNDQMHFGFLDPRQGFEQLYTSFPPVTKDQEATWAINDYASKFRVRPDGNKMVVSTYIGGVLDIYDISQHTFQNDTTCYFYQSEFEYIDGPSPRWVKPTDKTIIGFQDLHVTSDAIYGLIYGVSRKESEQAVPVLVKFDWDGNIIAQYRLNDRMECCATDSGGNIFGIAPNEEHEYILKVYPCARPS